MEKAFDRANFVSLKISVIQLCIYRYFCLLLSNPFFHSIPSDVENSFEAGLLIACSRRLSSGVAARSQSESREK